MLPKRLTWFGVGVATGALGVTWGYVKAREATTVDADQVARVVVGAARGVGGRLADLVAESRQGMVEAEADLRAGRVRRGAPLVAVEPAPAPAGAAVGNRRRRSGRRSVG